MFELCTGLIRIKLMNFKLFSPIILILDCTNNWGMGEALKHPQVLPLFFPSPLGKGRLHLRKCIERMYDWQRRKFYKKVILHLIRLGLLISLRMSSLVSWFMTASLKDQSSNKPLVRQTGPSLKTEYTCRISKYFFSRLL